MTTLESDLGTDGCTCTLVPESMWTTHYGAVEPGSQWEANPDCMVHFPKPEPKPWGWTSPDPTATYSCSCTGCWACAGNTQGCTCDVDWDKVYGHE